MKEINIHEPTIAPSINNHQELDEEASKKEIEKGDSTSVTRLYIDRMPEE